MKNLWKRTGWFGLALTALIASLGLQIIMGVIAILPASFMAGIEAGMQGITDVAEIEALVLEKSMGAAVWGVLFYHVISLPVFGLWYYFGCGRSKAVSPAKVFSVKSFLATLIAGFGLCLLANGIAMLLQYLTPTLFEQYVQMMETAGMGESPIAIIAAVLLAPIGEEILCRGIVMHYGEKMASGIGSEKVSFWIANVLQALLFGIMHGNFVQGTYAFILGMGLGLLRRRYNSLYPAMLCHFAINFLSTYVMGILFGWVPENAFGTILLFVMGIIITTAAAYLMKPTPTTDQATEEM